MIAARRVESRLRRLLAVDLTKFDLRTGVLGTIAILCAVAVVAVFGLVGETAGLAALFVLATDRPGTARRRLLGVLVMTTVGSVIAFLAVLVGTDSALGAAVLTFTITAIATLATARGPSVAGRALLLSIWAVVALSFGGDARTAFELALAFLLGGTIAAAILWFQTRMAPPASDEHTIEDGVEHTIEEAPVDSLGALLHSAVAPIALIRAAAVAAATALGILWYPDHPIWPALTVLLVMASAPGEAIGAGVLRMFGTLAGVLAAEAIVWVADGSDAVLLVSFAVFGFAMFACKNVAYWIWVLFLTGVLILVQALAGADAEAAALDRLTATILGAALAFVGIGIGRLVAGAHTRSSIAPRAGD